MVVRTEDCAWFMEGSSFPYEQYTFPYVKYPTGMKAKYRSQTSLFQFETFDIVPADNSRYMAVVVCL